MAVASLVLGILSIITCFKIQIGFPVSICGIIIGAVAVGRKRSRNKMSIAGLVLSCIGFALNAIISISIIMMVIFIILGIAGIVK